MKTTNEIIDHLIAKHTQVLAEIYKDIPQATDDLPEQIIFLTNAQTNTLILFILGVFKKTRTESVGDAYKNVGFETVETAEAILKNLEQDIAYDFRSEEISDTYLLAGVIRSFIYLYNYHKSSK